MFAYEPPLQPTPKFTDNDRVANAIKNKINEICFNILQKEAKTSYPEVYDMLFEMIEQDYFNYIQGADHGFDE